MRLFVFSILLALLLTFSGAALAETLDEDVIESSGEKISLLEDVLEETKSVGSINTERSVMFNRIKNESINFDPDKVAEHLEEKGKELIGLAQSGSLFYLSFAVLAFLALLFVGIFFKALRKIAFSILFIACIGFVLINYWPEILLIGKSIGEWFTTVGGVEDANTSGI